MRKFTKSLSLLALGALFCIGIHSTPAHADPLAPRETVFTVAPETGSIAVSPEVMGDHVLTVLFMDACQAHNLGLNQPENMRSMQAIVDVATADLSETWSGFNASHSRWINLGRGMTNLSASKGSRADRLAVDRESIRRWTF